MTYAKAYTNTKIYAKEFKKSKNFKSKNLKF